MCRRVQGSQIFKQNWIILIRSRVIVILLIWVRLVEFWCFGLPVALGRGQVVGVSGDIWGHGGVTTCMHMHTNACIEIANGRRHGGIHVYHACACMCVCICVYACVHRTPPTLPYPPTSTHLPPPSGDPFNWSKFNNTWTNQDISILFEDLKSVENSPPMGGCMIWWAGGWACGLMGGIRSNR